MLDTQVAEATSQSKVATMLEVKELVKHYPQRPTNAVDGVSFTVGAGEIFGLLGPNGAGKTTTIGMLTTRVRPTSGQALVNGVDVVRDPVRAKQFLAVVPQRSNLDRSLSARENLTYHAAYFGIGAAERNRRADALLEQFGLGDRGSERVDRYSGGMAQRLMIARALMHTPRLLFLDEPTTGLDPQSRLYLWDRVQEMHAQGVTVLMTTHDMDEADKLCQRIAIMDNGKVLALDTPANLKKLIPGASTLEVQVRRGRGPLQPLLETIKGLPGVEGAEKAEKIEATPSFSGGGGHPGGHPASIPLPSAPAPLPTQALPDDGTLTIRVFAKDGGPLIVPVAQAVAAYGWEVRNLSQANASLEDVFIHLTGRSLR